MVKNNCCGDGVSSTFLAVMRCSLIFFAVLRCCGVQASPMSPSLRSFGHSYGRSRQKGRTCGRHTMTDFMSNVNTKSVSATPALLPFHGVCQVLFRDRIRSLKEENDMKRHNKRQPYKRSVVSSCLKKAKIYKRFLSTIKPQRKRRHSFGCCLCHPWISCLFQVIEIQVYPIVFAKRFICQSVGVFC